MKWISDDRLIKPIASPEQLNELLRYSYVRVEFSKWCFLQIAVEGQRFYVELYRGRNDVNCFELENINELWGIVLRFLNDYNSVDGFVGFGEGAAAEEQGRFVNVVSYLLLALMCIQFLLFCIFFNGEDFAPSILFNVLGCAVWCGTAIGIKNRRFFQRFYDASYSGSVLNFWVIACFGFVFGSAIIFLSYL